MPQQQPEKLSLGSLDPKQLADARDKLQADVERFAQSLQFFGRSAGIYQNAGKAIQTLGESKEGAFAVGYHMFEYCIIHLENLYITCHQKRSFDIAGQPVMLPLTQSVYVSGSLASVEHILVDIGTNYFVEVRSYRFVFSLLKTCH